MLYFYVRIFHARVELFKLIPSIIVLESKRYTLVSDIVPISMQTQFLVTSSLLVTQRLFN